MTEAGDLRPSGVAKQRLLSLDVFRGVTVAAMILVNNPGSGAHVFWPLEHAEWHGCTPTDLIMPFFLFIVGVSIAFAMDGRREDRAQHGALIWRAVRRTTVLFLLAWALGLFPTSAGAWDQLIHRPLERLAGLRLMGVLQRIGVVYLVCVLVFVKAGVRGWVLICLGILAAYWAALAFVPVPLKDASLVAWGPATLEPSGNLGAWVDRTLLTRQHLYKQADWDPEGPFSTINAVATGLMGIIAGRFLKRGLTRPAETTAWMMTVAGLLVVAGWCWSLAVPLNKQLWTSSYAVYTGGLALAGLGLCYWFVDVQGYRRWVSPFVAFGVNAITAFWGSGLMVRALGLWQVPWDGKTLGVKQYAFQRWVAPWFTSPEMGSLVGGLIFVALWWAIMAFMDRRKWYIKV
jgi:predicted acyltransferase